jgi:hypothetical protein
MDASTTSTHGRLRPDLLPRLLYIAFVVLACWQALHWIQQDIHRYLPKNWAFAHEFDGLEDWLASRFYVAGKNPYSPESLAELKRIGLGHPPTTTFWFIPFGYLEKPIVAEVIDLSTMFLLVVHIFLCARVVRLPAPVASTALIFAWMFTTDGLAMHWHLIQESEQIAFLLVMSWYFLRRGQEIPAGIALGMGATIKLFPGVLMLFLLMARRYRAFAAAVAVYVGIALFMTATYGFSAWTLSFQQQSVLARIWVGSVCNASLQSLVLRIKTPVCVGSGPGDASTTVIASIVGVLLLALAARLTYPLVKRARSEDPRLIDVPYSVFTVLATFLNPWIWEHYYLILIQPVFVLAAAALTIFRSSLRGWLDEAGITTRRLVRDSVLAFLVLGGIAASAAALSTSIYAKRRLEELWRGIPKNPTPWVHLHLHIAEILNFLPWVTMVVLSFVMAAWYGAWARSRPTPSIVSPAGEN